MKHRRRLELEAAARDVPDGIARRMGMAEAAIHAVITNRAIWAEEEARTDAPPLPWPLEAGGEGLPAVLRWLATGTVETVLNAQAQTGTRTELQVVLRVVKRAVDRAETILAPRWNRLTGWRDFLNWLKAERMAEAARLGLKGHDAAAFAGLSVAGSYRAQHRKRRR